MPSLPRRLISSVNSRTTRLPEIEVSGMAARHSRVTSSTMLSKRKRQPQANWSYTKSSDQRAAPKLPASDRRVASSASHSRLTEPSGAWRRTHPFAILCLPAIQRRLRDPCLRARSPFAPASCSRKTKMLFRKSLWLHQSVLSIMGRTLISDEGKTQGKVTRAAAAIVQLAAQSGKAGLMPNAQQHDETPCATFSRSR